MNLSHVTRLSRSLISAAYPTRTTSVIVQSQSHVDTFALHVISMQSTERLHETKRKGSITVPANYLNFLVTHYIASQKAPFLTDQLPHFLPVSDTPKRTGKGPLPTVLQKKASDLPTTEWEWLDFTSQASMSRNLTIFGLKDKKAFEHIISLPTYQLTSLSLWGTSDGRLKDQDVCDIAHHLSQSTTLSHVDLQDNAIGTAGMEAIVEAFSSIQSQRKAGDLRKVTIDLRKNKIDAEGEKWLENHRTDLKRANITVIV